VAHQMTVMTLQAEGARRLAGDSDPRVEAALDTIREAGHEALREMRMMVGLLRSTDSDQALAPQPGLHQLEELVAGMSEAGLDVDLEVVGSGPDLPDGIELSAYRIVQEALTNSLKHGGPSVTAKVSIHRLPQRLEIEVVDDGRGITARDGAGHGLVGMRERVALVGGTLEAGPRAGGGYRVQALLPLEHT
jgi:signal transduction histidine kinase